MGLFHSALDEVKKAAKDGTLREVAGRHYAVAMSMQQHLLNQRDRVIPKLFTECSHKYSGRNKDHIYGFIDDYEDHVKEAITLLTDLSQLFNLMTNDGHDEGTFTTAFSKLKRFHVLEQNIESFPDSLNKVCDSRGLPHLEALRDVAHDDKFLHAAEKQIEN